MEFYNPNILYALSLLAIPIIIHLFNLRRYKTVLFSNISLLKDVQQQTKSKSQLKKWLVLLTRLIIYTAVILSFANPYIPTNKNNKNKPEEIAAGIYIDNSFSMENEGQEGILFENAKSKAVEIIEAYPLSTSFYLLENNLEAKYQRPLSREKIIEEIATLKTSPKQRKLSEIIKKFSLNEKNKKIYALTDLQKNTTDIASFPKDSNISLHIIHQKPQITDNVYIDSCYFENPTRQPGKEEVLTVRLFNGSNDNKTDFPVRLYINDSLKAVQTVNLEAGKYTKTEIKYVNINKGFYACRIEIDDYPIRYDNNYYYSYKISSQIKVLNIYSEKTNKYIDAIYKSDDYFKLENKILGKVKPAEIEDYDLIIISESISLSKGLSAKMIDYVSTRGNIMIIPTLDKEKYVETKELLKLFSGPELIKQDTGKLRLGNINLQSDFFNGVFEDITDDIELPYVFNFLKYQYANYSDFETLLFLEDKTPIFSKYTIGVGTVYLFATSLKEETSGISKHPLIVPCMLNPALTGKGTDRIYNIIEDNNNISINIENNEFNYKRVFIKENSSGNEFIPEYRTTGGNLSLNIRNRIENAGIYSLRTENKEIGLLAFNYNNSESNTEYYSTKDVMEQALLHEIDYVNILDSSIDNLKHNVSKINKGISLWYWFLIISLIFLFIEILLLRFSKS